MVNLFPRRWHADRDFIAAPLRWVRGLPLRLDRFPRGVDNAHIDVALPPELQEAARQWVEAVVREEVRRGFWHGVEGAADREVAEVFRNRYQALSRLVVHEARRRARQEWVQLFLIATLKLLHSEVDAAIAGLRAELEHKRSEADARVSGYALTLHERLVSLSRHHGLVRYRCAQHVIRQWGRQEQAGLRKLRETVLGVPWPVSDTLLLNPLLGLGGMGVPEAFLNHYPLVLHDGRACVELQRQLLAVLSPWLPDGVAEGVVGRNGATDPQQRVDQGELPGYAEVERRLRELVSPAELSAKAHSWLDDPENVVLVLGGRSAGGLDAGPWRHPRWARHQVEMVARLTTRLRRSGLLRRAAAAYAVADLFPAVGLKDNALTLLDYLVSDMGRRQLQRRLESASVSVDMMRLQRQLHEASRQVRRAVKGDAARLLTVRLVSDFCRLRRDLKQAWLAYRAMDAVRLLDDPQEVALSRANGLLQDFSEGAGEQGDSAVIGHVILKADVRGSTGITTRMRERNLNPAAYFSRNLYGPINALLKAYGASKVFVEGDAVILMLVERHDMQLAVARACGLARKILGVIQAKNAESRRHGLPELEIGLGIAYADEPPTYLYDEGHRITISPAINRADQLSSCHPALKALQAPALQRGMGLEVVHPVTSGNRASKDLEHLWRYNVNGIELDVAAFQRLRGELRLQEREAVAGVPPGRYFSARFQDANGGAHWLLIREAPVWLLVGNELAAGEPAGRMFYEVVGNPELVARVLRPEEAAAQPQFP